MIRRICAVGASLALVFGALTLAGCGSSSSTSRAPHTNLPSGATLVEAADRSYAAPGYRLTATIDTTVGSIHAEAHMQGVVAEHGAAGAFTAHETVDSRRIAFQFRSVGGHYYMTGLPGLTMLTHGRRWLSFDVAQADAAAGFGGLQSTASSNPAQFLGYLRTVGSGITRIGTTTIDGDATTEYRATLDLDRYARLVPSAERAQASRSVARLERVLGAHTLPVTVWVDARHDVRRIDLTIPECVNGEHVSIAMSMQLSDYGTATRVTVPPASETADVTSHLASQLKSGTADSSGCAATSG